MATAVRVPQASIEEIELDLLLDGIRRTYDYDFTQYARPTLLRRLTRALERFGLDSFSHLQHAVLRDPACFAQLLEFLTIQVSAMFRDPPYFLALREKVIPHLSTFPSIKVWVAGCANGEEFYSLAILFREAGLQERTLFYCTDISPSALSAAQKGIYPLDRISEFSTNYRDAGGTASLSDYYTAGYGAAVFDKSLRRKAVFSAHNLAIDHVFSEVHLVSCRNVLIYFTRPLQDRAVGLFAQALVYGGFLGLGTRETVQFSSHFNVFTTIAGGEKIFRRSTADHQGLTS